MLSAVHNPITTITDSGAFHTAYVGTCPGLSHSECIHALTANRWHQIPFNLFPLTCHQDVLRSPKEMVQRHRTTPQLALNKRKFNVVQPSAPDAFRKITGIKTQIQRLLFDLLRNFCGDFASAFNKFLVRINFFLNKRSDRVRNHQLFVCLSVDHRFNFFKEVYVAAWISWRNWTLRRPKSLSIRTSDARLARDTPQALALSFPQYRQGSHEVAVLFARP